MIGLEDRRIVAQSIVTAHTAGARLRMACETARVAARTLQRWKAHTGLTAGRWQAERRACHAQPCLERGRACASSGCVQRAVPPARIVPILADEGRYLASESSFIRVLRHTGRARNDSNHGAHMVCRAAPAEGIAPTAPQPVLHRDNGSTPKATAFLQAELL